MIELERRQFLQTGVGVAACSAVAGCLDGDDEEVTEEDVPLGIDHVRLVEEEPSGYREYTERAGGVYEGEELVWIYYEPVGLATEEAGSGTVEFDITVELTVTGPDGETNEFEEAFDREVAEGAADEQFLFWSFQPSSPVTAGQYTADLQLTDNLAGETVTEETEFTIEGDEPDEELGIDHVRLVDGQPAGYRQYTEQSQGIYGTADVVWIYYEPENLTAEDVDGGGVEIDITIELTVTDPDGETETFDDVIRQTVDEEELDELFLTWNFRPEEPVSTGEYTAVFSLTDEHTGQEASAETEFGIEEQEPDAEFIDVFAASLRDEEIDIEIDGLAERDGIVELVYDSAEPIGSDESDFEISFVAGAFAANVGDGWGVTGLRATVLDSQGDPYRYTVDAGLAADWIDDQITDEEFIGPVFESLEPVDDE